MQAAKRAVMDGAELEAALDHEQQCFRAVLASDDAVLGVEAFLERRTPAFTHR